MDIPEQDRTELESAKLAAIVTASDAAIVSKTIETGGPHISAPSGWGFGATLIERAPCRPWEANPLPLWLTGPGGPDSLTLPEHARETGISAVPARTDMRALPRSGSEQSLDGKRMIVVEDEALVLMELESSLTDAGCEVVGTAGTFDEAKVLSAEADCDAALLDAT